MGGFRTALCLKAFVLFGWKITGVVLLFLLGEMGRRVGGKK